MGITTNTVKKHINNANHFFEEKVIKRHFFLVFDYTNHDFSRLYIKTAL